MDEKSKPQRPSEQPALHFCQQVREARGLARQAYRRFPRQSVLQRFFREIKSAIRGRVQQELRLAAAETPGIPEDLRGFGGGGFAALWVDAAVVEEPESRF